MIALSSSLSVPDSFKSVGTTDPSTLKKAIFWAHGTADYLPISCQLPELSLLNIYCLLLIFSSIGATQSVDYLVNSVGFKKIAKNEVPTPGTVTWSSYKGLKHEANEEELEDIQKW